MSTGLATSVQAGRVSGLPAVGVVILLVVMRVCGACVPPPPLDTRLAWSDVTPPGVVPSALAITEAGFVVAGTDATGAVPALAHADGAAITLVPSEPYAASAALVGVVATADPARLYAIGGRSGGAHGNVRWTVWDGPLTGPLISRPQEFLTFGGHDAGQLLGVVTAAGRPVIVGSRADEDGPLAALYMASGETWHHVETPALLRSGKSGILGFTAAAGTGAQVVIVGDVVTADATGTVQTPALFHGSISGAWTRVDLPVPQPRVPGLSHATSVACDLEACWVAGWSGGPITWHVSLVDVSVLATSALAGDAPQGTDPTALVALVGGRPIVVTNSATPTIAVGCHATWTTFPAPGAATAVIAEGSDLYVVAGTIPRLWHATIPTC